MISIIKDLYWWLFGASADAWCEKHKPGRAATGLIKWAETDYYSYSSGTYRGRKHKIKDRILQPGE